MHQIKISSVTQYEDNIDDFLRRPNQTDCFHQSLHNYLIITLEIIFSLHKQPPQEWIR